MITSVLRKNRNLLFGVFRILVGLLFLQHGAQKLFGLFGGNAASAFSLMWVAGIIEFFGGALLALGLLTRFVAVIGAVEMPVAYFMSHFPNGWVPIQNKGELALLYFACFLAIAGKGPGDLGLDNYLFGKKKSKKR